MRNVAEGVVLSGPVLAVAVALAGYLVLVQPVVGGWSQARFERRIRLDSGARVARYRRTLLSEWGLCGIASLVVAMAGGMDLVDIGVRPPALSGGAAPFTIIGSVGLVGSGLLLAGLRGRLRHDRVDLSGPPRIVALLPRTTRERQVFVWLALTAGVCEEVLYRGFLLAVVAALAPGLRPWGSVAVAGLAFGVAHAYQGAAGVVATGILGGCLTILYLGSGSLLLPVLYHVLVDLRVLVLSTVRSRPRHAADRDGERQSATGARSRRFGHAGHTGHIGDTGDTDNTNDPSNTGNTGKAGGSRNAAGTGSNGIGRFEMTRLTVAGTPNAEPALRPVRDDDSAALIALIGGCWAEYPGVLLDVDGEEPWMRAPADAYARWGGRMWVATGAGTLVGCVGTKPHGPGVVELKSLYVAAAARRRGLGSRLTRLVEEEAWRAGALRVDLWSDSRFLDAHRLYSRLGYHRTGRTRELGDLSETTEYEFTH
ncbi:MAG TPA: GNAT family N-acetyltransferase, partial [Mycobacteriales bacterium]